MRFKIFEPVRDAFFVQKTPFEPPTMQFMLHDKPLPVDVEVAVIMERTVKQLDADDMFLLNLLYAPRRSRLHSMMKVLVRIEIVGQILAWPDPRDREPMPSTSLRPTQPPSSSASGVPMP